MGNSAGVWAVLAAFVRPGLVVPHVMVDDLRDIDWRRLRQEGKVDHVVIDKDNCITLPLRDQVAPAMETAWQRLTSAGFRSILIVSNSAGSSDDPMALGAEQLARRLGQTVLAHPDKKPAMGCARQVVDVIYRQQPHQTAEAGQPDAEEVVGRTARGNVAVVGDRITTDMVLASRIDRTLRQQGIEARAIGVLTTAVLERERWGTRGMRSMEMWCLHRLQRLGIVPGAFWWTKKTVEGREDIQRWTKIVSRDADIPSTFLNTAQHEATEQSAESVTAMPTPSLLERVRNLPQSAVALLLSGLRHSFRFLGDGWHLINDGIRIGTKGQIGGQLSDATLPRNRHAALDRLASRPYPSTDAVSPFAAPPLPSLQQRLDQAKRITANRTTSRAYSTACQATKPKLATNPKPQMPKRNRVAFFAALIIIPAGLLGGMALKQYYELYQEKQRVLEEKASATTGMNLRPDTFASSAVSQSMEVNQSPSSSMVEATQKSIEPSKTVLLLRQERGQLRRQLEDLDDKLERLRLRQTSTK